MVIKQYKKEIVMSAIEQVIMNDFEKVYHGENNFNDWYYSQRSKLSLIADVASGVTKGVFFCKEVPEIVIKTPILNDSDYCKRELDNYLKAEEEGFEDYFAEIEFFAELNGVPFYIQTAADNDKALTSLWESASHDALAYCDYESEEEKSDAINYYLDEISDEERVDIFFGGVPPEFIQFLERNEINDIHEGNIGVIGERKVIFDYSGW